MSVPLCRLVSLLHPDSWAASTPLTQPDSVSAIWGERSLEVLFQALPCTFKTRVACTTLIISKRLAIENPLRQRKTSLSNKS